MDIKKTIIIASTPADTSKAQIFGMPVAHMAYRVGGDLTLLRGGIGLNVRGGLMVLNDTNYDGSGANIQELCRQVTRECLSRGFDGVIIDFEGSGHPELLEFIGELTIRLQKHNIAIIADEKFAEISQRIHLLVSGAITGGSLQEHLEDCISRHGRGRLILEIERIRHSFPLPSTDGRGKALSAVELEALIDEHTPMPFISQELCTNYYTYKDHEGSHFVLYDSTTTILKKIDMAARLGIGETLILYSEFRDVLEDIVTAVRQ